MPPALSTRNHRPTLAGATSTVCTPERFCSRSWADPEQRLSHVGPVRPLCELDADVHPDRMVFPQPPNGGLLSAFVRRSSTASVWLSKRERDGPIVSPVNFCEHLAAAMPAVPQPAGGIAPSGYLTIMIGDMLLIRPLTDKRALRGISHCQDFAPHGPTPAEFDCRQ